MGSIKKLLCYHKWEWFSHNRVKFCNKCGKIARSEWTEAEHNKLYKEAKNDGLE